MTPAEAFVPLAVTSRSGFAESVHFGAVVGLRCDGSVALAAGDPTIEIYPRSSNKPIQATAMLDYGLDMTPEMLALVCASHDGTPMHLGIARRILATVGLDESALRNTVGLPLDDSCADDIIRGGGGATALQQNCSGQHAGMIATCVINGWPVEGYLELDHPLQRAITAGFPALTGEQVAHIGVDGCGAPAHVMSLIGLATAFRNIATGSTSESGRAGDSARRVYEAMTGYPQVVGGEHRDVTLFMRLVPGLLAKDGADGVFAAALPDGRAIALKVSDGANRARPPTMVQAMQALDIDIAAVAPLVREPILGHGREVGEVSAVAEYDVAQYAAADSGGDRG